MGAADGPMRAVGLCQWVDVSAYVRSVSTDRGRRTELSSVSPGVASVTFSNGDRTFDPSNSAGRFAGKLTPMRRIRVSFLIGATVAWVFTGYVSGWPIRYVDKGADSVVTVKCTDGFRALALAACSGSAYGAAVMADAPTYYWPMQTVDTTILTPAIGGLELVPGSSSQGAFEVVSTSTLPVGQSSSLGSGTANAQTGTVSPPKSIEGWVTDPGSAGLGEVVFGAAGGSGNHLYAFVRNTMISITYSDVALNARSTATSGVFTEIPWPTLTGTHHVAVTVSSSAVLVYLDGVLFSTITTTSGTHSYTSGTTTGVGIGGWDTSTTTTSSVSHFAVYRDTTLSATQVQTHYLAGLTAYGHPWGERAGQRIGRILDNVGHPAVDRNIGTGETVLGQWTPASAYALDEIRACEDTEQGLFFMSADGKATFLDRQYTYTGTRAVNSQLTFGTGAGEIPPYDLVIAGNDIDFVRNVVTVTYPNGSVVAKDQASVNLYGEQSDSVSAAELPTWGGSLARILALWRLDRRDMPVSRVPMLTVKPLTDVANWALPLLQLELGDRVRVINRPSTGTGNFDQFCTVQGIAHNISADGNWTISFYLSPCPLSYTEGRYLTVGDATYGVIGESATPNVVPY